MSINLHSVFAFRQGNAFASTRAAAWCTALALALAGCADGQAEGAKRAPAAVEVGVVTVVSQPLALKTELAGRTVAALSAEVRPQVTALVRERLFQEGSQVKAGQPLGAGRPLTDR